MNKSDSGSAIYLIKEDFAAKLTSTSPQDRLFLPWYMGYQPSRQASGEFARLLQEDLSKLAPGWKCPTRSGPIAVLASTTMPSVALEIGNLNSTSPPPGKELVGGGLSIVDSGFQNKIVATIVTAIERYAAARRGGA